MKGGRPNYRGVNKDRKGVGAKNLQAANEAVGRPGRHHPGRLSNKFKQSLKRDGIQRMRTAPNIASKQPSKLDLDVIVDENPRQGVSRAKVFNLGSAVPYSSGKSSNVSRAILSKASLPTPSHHNTYATTNRAPKRAATRSYVKPKQKEPGYTIEQPVCLSSDEESNEGNGGVAFGEFSSYSLRQLFIHDREIKNTVGQISVKVSVSNELEIHGAMTEPRIFPAKCFISIHPLEEHNAVGVLVNEYDWALNGLNTPEEHHSGRLVLICASKDVYESLLNKMLQTTALGGLIHAGNATFDNPGEWNVQFHTAVRSTRSTRNSTRRVDNRGGSNLLLKFPKDARNAVQLRHYDLSCLRKGQYLNDNIIDFYLRYLFCRTLSEAQQKRFHIFSALFFKKFTERGGNYDAVRNWTKNVDLFEKDFVIIPVVDHSHWNAFIVYRLREVCKEEEDRIAAGGERQKDQRTIGCIFNLDSLGHSALRNPKKIRDYLNFEYTAKRGVTKGEKQQVTFTKDTLPSVASKVPVQPNGSDCGVFLLHYIELFVKDPQATMEEQKSVFSPTWFHPNDATHKRVSLKKLLFELSKPDKYETATLEAPPPAPPVTPQTSGVALHIDSGRIRSSRRKEKAKEKERNSDGVVMVQTQHAAAASSVLVDDEKVRSLSSSSENPEFASVPSESPAAQPQQISLSADDDMNEKREADSCSAQEDSSENDIAVKVPETQRDGLFDRVLSISGRVVQKVYDVIVPSAESNGKSPLKRPAKNTPKRKAKRFKTTVDAKRTVAIFDNEHKKAVLLSKEAIAKAREANDNSDDDSE